MFQMFQFLNKKYCLALLLFSSLVWADYIDKGNALFNEGKLGQSLQMYSMALEAGENPTLARYYKSNVLYKMGQTGRAVMEYQKIIREHPEFVKPYINLAGIYFEMDVVGEALSLYGKALKLEPENLLVIKMVAESYLKIENYPEAIRYFELGMDKEPQNEEWLYGLVESYQKLNDMVSIEMLLIDNINKFENNSLWFLLGDILNANGKKKEAALTYKKALQRDPGQELYYYKLSNLQSELNQPFLAINTLSKGLEAKVLGNDVYIELANMYYNLGDTDKSFLYFLDAYDSNVKGGFQGVLFLLEDAAANNDKRFMEFCLGKLNKELQKKPEIAEILSRMEG